MRPIGYPETSVTNYNLRRATSQKSEDLFYSASDCWNQASVKSACHKTPQNITVYLECFWWKIWGSVSHSDLARELHIPALILRTFIHGLHFRATSISKATWRNKKCWHSALLPRCLLSSTEMSAATPVLNSPSVVWRATVSTACVPFHCQTVP